MTNIKIKKFSNLKLVYRVSMFHKDFTAFNANSIQLLDTKK